MHYELKNPLFYPAFGVSMLFHSLAVLLSQTMLTTPIAIVAPEPSTITVLLSVQPKLPSVSTLPLSGTVKPATTQAVTHAKPLLKHAKPRITEAVKPKPLKQQNRQKARQIELAAKLKDLAGEKPEQPVINRPDNYLLKASAFQPNVNASTAHSSTNNTALAAYKNTAGNGVASSELPPLLKSLQPEYPEEARWEERTGKVTLSFQISAQGLVITPKITKSSGHRDLDVAAIEAIQVWRFDTQANHSQQQWYTYSFRFELD